MIFALTILPAMFLSVCAANWLILNHQQICENLNVGSDYGQTNKFGE